MAATATRQRDMVNDELWCIPGVGPSIARDLHLIGIHRITDWVGQDPEQLYRDLEMKKHRDQDRCRLYVLRCAVYFASTPRPEPEKLKWWNWKDRTPK